MLWINTNKVNAASTIIQTEINDLSILNNLPENFILDEKESEFEKAEQTLLNKIVEEFEKQDIVTRRR